MPKDPKKNEAQLSIAPRNSMELDVRAIHGDKLLDLIRRDRYEVLPVKSDIITMGHFHLQMVMMRNNTWILHSGHFSNSKMPREKGFLSHMCAPNMVAIPNEAETEILSYFEIHRG